MDYPMDTDYNYSGEEETQQLQIPSPKRPNIEAIECHTLDVRAYISRYDGYTKLKRLQFITENCSNLRLDSFHLLLDECKKGVNTNAYVNYVNLSSVLIDQVVELDQAWVDAVERKMVMRLDKLTNEASAARSSMINESIRMSYRDLGYHYYEIGNLTEAQRLFVRMRDYCNTNRQQSDMTFDIIMLLFDLNLAHTIPTLLSSKTTTWTDVISSAKAKAVLGLCELHDKNYHESAKHFLTIEKELESNYHHVISAYDISLYGVLCGIATIERNTLKSMIEAKSFKSYLDLNPSLREFVDNFYRRSYGDCLTYLSQHRNEWYLDIYLNKHIDSIISLIKERIIVEYFKPYNAISLVKMSESLNIRLDDLEHQIWLLILSNKLNALMDDENKTIQRKVVSQRKSLIDNVNDLNENHINHLKNGMFRLSIIKNNLALGNDGNDSVGRLDTFIKSSSSSAATAMAQFDHHSYSSRRRGLESMEPRIAMHPDAEGNDDMEDKD